MNQTRIGYQPGTSTLNNVINYLDYHEAHYPERVALSWVKSEDIKSWNGDTNKPFPTSQINYAEFARTINQLAFSFKNLGIKKGDRVIVFLPMGVLMYASMFAVQRIGAIAVFLDSWARRNHLGASAECVNPTAMISHKAAFDLISDIPEFSHMKIRIIAGGVGAEQSTQFTARLEELAVGKNRVPIEAVESEYTALITFTTGSSGKPKGANRTHRFLCAQHEALSEVIPYTDVDIDMPAFPIFSLNNLASGVTTIVPALDLSAPSKNDAAALTCQLLQHGITCTTLSPSMLNGVSSYCLANNLKLTNLRRVVTGGAPISEDNVRDFQLISPQAQIWVLYGSTEVEPMAHIEGKEMIAAKSKQTNTDPEVIEDGVNVGHISDTLDFKFIKIIKDKVDLKQTPWSQIEVGDGEVGEFIVTGDHVCRDYYNNEEAFFKTKIRGEDGRVWHRTGDLTYKDKNGYLWVVGRVHNAIIRDQKYYFPVKPEVILKRVPGVVQGAFLGMDDARLGEKTVAVLELSANAKAEKDQSISMVVAEVKRLFAKNNIPVDELYLTDKIPMDPRHHSKVEYEILREILKDALKNGIITRNLLA